MTYRPELPPIPVQMRRLPTHNGYPIPWFVLQGPGIAVDLRIADASKRSIAVRDGRCWVCGGGLNRLLTFPIDPMCTVNRIAPEPPSHFACALYSAQGCPFLNQRMNRRRVGHYPDEIKPMPGEPVLRQPGVVCLWSTHGYRPFSDGHGGVLYHINSPVTPPSWWRLGQEATREQVLEAFETGMVTIRALAEEDRAAGHPDAPAEAEAAYQRALAFLPA